MSPNRAQADFFPTISFSILILIAGADFTWEALQRERLEESLRQVNAGLDQSAQLSVQVSDPAKFRSLPRGIHFDLDHLRSMAPPQSRESELIDQARLAVQDWMESSAKGGSVPATVIPNVISRIRDAMEPLSDFFRARRDDLEKELLLTMRRLEVSLLALFLGSLFLMGVLFKKRVRLKYEGILKERETENEALLATLEDQERRLSSRNQWLQIGSSQLRGPLATLEAQLDYLDRLSEKNFKQIFQDQQIPLPLRATFSQMFRSVRESISAGRRISWITGNLKDYSDLQSGSFQAKAETVDLTERVRSVLSRCEEVEPDQEFVLIAPKEVIASTDTTRLDSILFQLILNAIRFGQKKPVEIEVGTNWRTSTVFIRVEDKGAGISTETIDAIFEGKLAQNSFGMGLYVAREVLRRQGGNLRLVSEKGKGSACTIELPLLARAAKQEPDEPQLSLALESESVAG